MEVDTTGAIPEPVEPEALSKVPRKDATNVLVREPGRTLFPISRVQKILKADKELPIIAKEAVFAISIATEEFIKQLSSACQKQAEREKRATVQKKDFVAVTKRADEFWFLEDIVAADAEYTLPTMKRKKDNPGKQQQLGAAAGPLDQFAKKADRKQLDDDSENASE